MESVREREEWRGEDKRYIYNTNNTKEGRK